MSFLVATLQSGRACVDSLRLNMTPVQCFGLRNGSIEVDSVMGGTAPFYYSIDGQTFSTNPVFDRLWTGQYKISVRDASGCVSSWDVSVTQPEPFEIILSISDSVVFAGEKVSAQVRVFPDTTLIGKVSWRSPMPVETDAELSCHIRPTQSTTLAVEISNPQGCIARDQKYIHVDETSIFFPNAIKPGSSQNAWFTGFGGDGVARIGRLQIFSRTGAVIFDRENFEPNAPLLGWSGRWSGRYVQTGTYTWIAEIVLLDGFRIVRHGTVDVVY